MINRLFRRALTLVRVLGSLLVSTGYGTRYRSEHYHRDVQLNCQRFQTEVCLAYLLDAILVPFSMNTRLDHMQMVNQNECDMMHLD